MEDKKRNYYCYILRLYPEYFDFDVWTEKENELIGIHFAYLKDLIEKKILFLAGRSVNEPMTEKDFGIAILETKTEEEAHSYMENDPAVKGKLMRAELFEFSLALLRE